MSVRRLCTRGYSAWLTVQLLAVCLSFPAYGAREIDRLVRPSAVAFDSAGRILITDWERRELLRYDSDDGGVEVFGDAGDLQLKLPLGLGLGPDDTIYVADAGLRTVLSFDAAGRYLGAFGSAENLTNPADVAVSPDGSRLFVADSRAHRIVAIDRASGEVASSFGLEGEGPGEFRFPTSLAFGSDERLYVADQENSRIQIFSPEGEFLEEFGGAATGMKTLDKPRDVAFDESGAIYVADFGHETVHVFNPDLSSRGRIGERGRGKGRFRGVSGVAVRGESLAVVDEQGGRLHLLRALPGLRAAEPKPLPAAVEVLSPQPEAAPGTTAIEVAAPGAPTEIPEAPTIAAPEAMAEEAEPAEIAPEATTPEAIAPLFEPPVEPDSDAVLAAVEAWAAAWSSQDAERYLSFYSARFVPEGGLSRRDWEQQRGERLERPRFIRVLVESPRVVSLGRETARVSFLQTYASDRFSDRVRKTLDLVLEGGEWRIERERVGEAL